MFFNLRDCTFKFILAKIRFCINNLSPQDKATVATHKGFLKDNST